MNKIDEINEIINALEEMSCEHAFSHGQMAVKEFIPKIIETFDKEIELQSRKEKLVVGSEWECLVDCLCSVEDNKKQRKVGLIIGKGSKFKIYEFIEVLGRVKIKEPLKFDIPADQFLLCFKPKGEK
jgi:hypothetical protein